MEACGAKVSRYRWQLKRPASMARPMKGVKRAMEEKRKRSRFGRWQFPPI